MKDLVQEIKDYVKVLDSDLSLNDKHIEMMMNRTKVYPNRKDIPFILASTIAQMLVEQSDMTKKNADDIVSSISDNGQSISFSNKVYQSLISQTDAQLFGSHTAILNRFRKVGVIGVNPFKDE
ncbi:hypothetical protein MGH68_13870 [Erysipelothrix sp. D19-032]